MNWKKTLTNFAKQKRAIVGLEAAIILIAFVIIAAVFSFMVINQGVFAT
jgi:flagellin FlaB